MTPNTRARARSFALAAAILSWTDARSDDNILLDLEDYFPDQRVNGRFFGLLGLDHATVAAAENPDVLASYMSFRIADEGTDDFDGTAANSWNDDHWVRDSTGYLPRTGVSTFYDDLDGLNPTIVTSQWSTVLIDTDPDTGNPRLRITFGPPGHEPQTVATDLNCTAINATEVCL